MENRRFLGRLLQDEAPRPLLTNTPLLSDDQHDLARQAFDLFQLDSDLERQARELSRRREQLIRMVEEVDNQAIALANRRDEVIRQSKALLRMVAETNRS